MNHIDIEIYDRLKLYIKQIEKEKYKNLKLLIVINLIIFLNNKKEWINDEDRKKLKNVVIHKINEFNIIINKNVEEYHVNLIKIFQEKSNLFLK